MQSYYLKRYAKTLSEKKQNFINKLGKDDIDRLNVLTEGLYMNAKLLYEASQASPNPTPLSYSELEKLVIERKNCCIRELHDFFSPANMEKVENKLLGKEMGLSGEDIKTIKQVEKVTGQSILKKYGPQRKDDKDKPRQLER